MVTELGCWRPSVIPAVCFILSYAEFMVWMVEQSNGGTVQGWQEKVN